MVNSRASNYIYPIERDRSGFYIRFFIFNNPTFTDTGFEDLAGINKDKFQAFLTINNGQKLINNTYTTSAVTAESNVVLTVNRLMDGNRSRYVFLRGGYNKTRKRKSILKKNKTKKHKLSK